ncbi:uncharacterized protein DUF3243 [Cytobacillus firmus]|uniref:Uncharacterized protein DUF3243 n=2 Tax=Cytobacillus TaxID=2675230 RepID=A0A366K3F5_CYTFI|nr:MULTISPECIES: DUF3243 domain-containing protein [Cytobacillus]RBP96255.1 uncharacterized protein DUF3243 [Cytobacillus firmus]TDX46020.1 uncharacterized protein DUF3243 [Cytobacillus oceanisediminis]
MEQNMNKVNGQAGNVEEKLSNMESEKKDEILSSFDGFKEYLSGKVSLGQKMGMDEEQLANTAQKVGDYLASKEDPRNREEKLLQELWKVGTEEEKHKLSHMLVKLVG